jgi:toluene monooxygenase electron transfer component
MPQISLAGSDTHWHCDDDDTILRSALRAGLGFPYECNVGSCGNCRFELIDGEVLHRRADPPGLSERDRERGRRLGCQARPLSDCTVKLRLMPQYESRFRPVRQKARLVATSDLTHDMREFQFKLATPQQFRPGQYALLDVEGVEGSRAYSMCNTGDEGSEWHFQIKRVPGGEASQRLFDALAPGAMIGIDGPYGMAYLRESSSRDIICLAGGSGLSPMVSIARAAAPALGGRRLDFFYGGRSPKDLCGRDILAGLPGFGTQLRYHAAVSGEGDWDGHKGFVHEVADGLLGDRIAASEIYFAGPPAMGEAVQKMLAARGVPAEQIHFDRFY